MYLGGFCFFLFLIESTEILNFFSVCTRTMGRENIDHEDVSEESQHHSDCEKSSTSLSSSSGDNDTSYTKQLAKKKKRLPKPKQLNTKHHNSKTGASWAKKTIAHFVQMTTAFLMLFVLFCSCLHAFSIITNLLSEYEKEYDRASMMMENAKRYSQYTHCSDAKQRIQFEKVNGYNDCDRADSDKNINPRTKAIQEMSKRSPIFKLYTYLQERGQYLVIYTEVTIAFATALCAFTLVRWFISQVSALVHSVDE